MTNLNAGDIVDITIKGARIATRHVSEKRLWVEIDGGDFVLPIHDSVTVERVAPAEWPPQPGDVWRDCDGGVWFVYGVASDALRIVSAAEMPHTGAWWPERLLSERGPLLLVHREDGELR